MKTLRSRFLLAAGASALTVPLLAGATVANADPAPVSYDSRLMGAPKFVEVDGIRTRYFDAGRGPTMVLIHGGQWPATASADGFAAIFDPGIRAARCRQHALPSIILNSSRT